MYPVSSAPIIGLGQWAKGLTPGSSADYSKMMASSFTAKILTGETTDGRSAYWVDLWSAETYGSKDAEERAYSTKEARLDAYAHPTLEAVLDALEGQLRARVRNGERINWGDEHFTDVDSAVAAIRANPVTEPHR